MKNNAPAASADFIESAFCFAGDPVLVCNRRGRIMQANPACLRLLGYGWDELCGQSAETLLPDGVHPPPLLERLLYTGCVKNYICRIKTKNGSVVPANATVTLVPDTAGGISGAVAVIRPAVNDEHAASVRPRVCGNDSGFCTTKEFLENIFENSIDCIVTSDHTGRLTSVNSAFLQLLGYDMDEVLGKTMAWFSPHPETEYPSVTGTTFVRKTVEYETLVEKMSTLQDEGKICSLMSYLIRKDGHAVPVEENIVVLYDTDNTMVGSVGIIRDITEHIKTIDSLRESELRFKNLADSLPQTVFEVDREGTITFINRFGLDSLGYSQADFDRGLTIHQLISPEERLRLQQSLSSVLRGERPGNHEYTALRKDSTTFPCIIHASPEFQKTGTAEMLGILIDITERKNLEDELLKMRRLESIAALAGGLAQDFNAIISAVLGSINIAQHYSLPGDKISEQLDLAEKNTLRAKDLTDQLLLFSRGAEAVKKTVAVGDVIHVAVSRLSTRSGIQCDVRLPDTLRLCYIDPEQIVQVFTTILNNADYAMPEGGTIIISGENITVSPGDNLPLQNGGYIKIIISDQSIGILNEHVQNLFDPYFTSRQRGSGIGLATAYTIIKNHGGLITVESEFGRGTSFHLYLPAAQTSS